MTETRAGTPRWDYVLGVDPGSTTGMAVVRFDRENRGRPEAVWADQQSWDDAANTLSHRVGALRALTDGGRAASAAVACERFTVNAQTAQRGQGPAEDALGMVGVVRLFCLWSGVTLGPLEQASAAKRLVGDDVLRSNNLYAPGLGHANDASRHALLYAVKAKLMKGAWLVQEGR